MKRPRWGAHGGHGGHHGERDASTQGRRQGRVLHRHPSVGAKGTCATFPLVSFYSGLQVVRIAKTVVLAFQRIQILGVPEECHTDISYQAALL